METIHYLNLTNGLEWLLYLAYLIDSFRVIRIQSSWCEQKHFIKLINDIDHDLLFNLAIGNYCIIYDFSAKKQMSKALSQGVSFLRYCIERNWFNRDEIKFSKGMEVHFRQVYNGFNRSDKKKLRYYRRFLMCEDINLACVCANTDHDNDWKFYQKIIKEKM